MTTPTERIQKALDSALRSFAIANSINYELENIGSGQQSTDTPYLAGYFLPVSVEDADLYFTDRRTGIYQIDICYGSGGGTATINRMTDLLNAHFKPGSVFVSGGFCVEITNFSPERVNISNGWAIKPCSITFVCYTKRL